MRTRADEWSKYVTTSSKSISSFLHFHRASPSLISRSRPVSLPSSFESDVEEIRSSLAIFCLIFSLASRALRFEEIFLARWGSDPTTTLFSFFETPAFLRLGISSISPVRVACTCVASTCSNDRFDSIHACACKNVPRRTFREVKRRNRRRKRVYTRKPLVGDDMYSGIKCVSRRMYRGVA